MRTFLGQPRGSGGAARSGGSTGLSRSSRVLLLLLVVAPLLLWTGLLSLLLDGPQEEAREDHASSEALERLEGASDPWERQDTLIDAAKAAFEIGSHEQAQRYAKELLDRANQYCSPWNYGQAIHDANMVLGRVALARGDIKLARKQLLRAGAAPPSPSLSTFGPNMSLARDLLVAGETDVVLEYLDLCRRFWINDHGDLDEWEAAIRAGRAPDFTLNLDN